LRKNAAKERKSFLQGLKPVESTQFTSALKHRPPEERVFPQSARFYTTGLRRQSGMPKNPAFLRAGDEME
jgi:hypothetical protein